MTAWICQNCGHIYDEAEGDPDSGISPGTRFEDLPADWICPDCMAGRDMYALQENA